MKTFVVDKNAKLSRFLLEKYEGELSFSSFNKLLRKKDIRINGKKTGTDTDVATGDTVAVYFDGVKKQTERDIVFADENVLVAIKPKGITSERFFDELKEKFPPLYFCHRLDRNTDGIMIFAKTERAYSEILSAFKTRKFDKYYYACVYGVFGKKEGTLKAFLTKDSLNATVKITKSSIAGAKPIETAYKVINEDRSKNISLLEVELLTGRTHQIRAHLSYEGHFVLGDGKYGENKISRSLGVKDVCLTAHKLVLHFEKGDPLYYLDKKEFYAPSDLAEKFFDKN